MTTSYVLTILGKPVAIAKRLNILFEDDVFGAAFIDATDGLFIFNPEMSVKGAYTQATRALKAKSQFTSETNGERPFSYSISRTKHYERERKN